MGSIFESKAARDHVIVASYRIRANELREELTGDLTVVDVDGQPHAGYVTDDGSVMAVDLDGGFAVTNALGERLIDTLGPCSEPKIRQGIPSDDYADMLDDLAAFVIHDATELKYGEGVATNEAVALWAQDKSDELSILACYREDKRLEEMEEN